jgi:hypothetical protein
MAVLRVYILHNALIIFSANTYLVASVPNFHTDSTGSGISQNKINVYQQNGEMLNGWPVEMD